MKYLVTISGSPGIGNFNLIKDLKTDFEEANKYSYPLKKNYLIFHNHPPKHCDIKYYGIYGSTYNGLSSSEIKNTLTKKDVFLFISKPEVIQKLKTIFGKQMKSIWLDSPWEKDMFNVNVLGEKPTKIISEADFYKNNLKDNYTNNSQLYDLIICLLYTSPSPRDQRGSRMPSSA